MNKKLVHNSRIVLGSPTYQSIDRDCQEFSQKVDWNFKSWKANKVIPKTKTTVCRRCPTGYLTSLKIGGRFRIEANDELGNSPEVEK